jgi:outer membrane lipoprotein SlyB
VIASFRDLCIDANDPQAVGAFWAAVLGRTADDAGQGEGATRDVFLQAGPDGGPSIHVNGVREPKAVKDRLHVDVTLEPGSEVTDLLRLGATVVTEPGEVRWWVLADPEGNEFCAFPAETDATNDADAEVPV